MPKLTVNGKTAEVPANQRLVLAIESLGIAIGHRCGGKARCTTCRVAFIAGEPEQMTQAEYDKLRDKGLYGQVRLACQILCSHDMAVRPLMTRESEGWPDSGPTPAEQIEPEPHYITPPAK